MIKFVKVLAWIVFVASAAAAALGLLSLPVMAGDTPNLEISATAIGGGLGGLLISGCALLIVGIAQSIAQGFKSTISLEEMKELESAHGQRVEPVSTAQP